MNVHFFDQEPYFTKTTIQGENIPTECQFWEIEPGSKGINSSPFSTLSYPVSSLSHKCLHLNLSLNHKHLLSLRHKHLLKPSKISLQQILLIIKSSVFILGGRRTERKQYHKHNLSKAIKLIRIQNQRKNKQVTLNLSPFLVRIKVMIWNYQLQSGKK